MSSEDLHTRHVLTHVTGTKTPHAFRRAPPPAAVRVVRWRHLKQSPVAAGGSAQLGAAWLANRCGVACRQGPSLIH